MHQTFRLTPKMNTIHDSQHCSTMPFKNQKQFSFIYIREGVTLHSINNSTTSFNFERKKVVD